MFKSDKVRLQLLDSATIRNPLRYLLIVFRKRHSYLRTFRRSSISLRCISLLRNFLWLQIYKKNSSSKLRSSFHISVSADKINAWKTVVLYVRL